MKFVALTLLSLAIVPAHAKTFKVHYMENAPFTFIGDDGKHAGLFPRLIEKMCIKAGHKCEFIGNTAIARSEDLMKKGESDIVGGVAYSKERAEYMEYAPMVSQSDYTFFTKKGEASAFKKLEDVKGKTVAVHASSALGRDLERVKKDVFKGELKVEGEANADTPVKKLGGGRYPAGTLVYTIRPVGMFLAKQKNLDIEAVDFATLSQSHGIAFSKKSVTPEEAKALKAALAEVVRSEEAKKIFAEYSMTPHPESR